MTVQGVQYDSIVGTVWQYRGYHMTIQWIQYDSTGGTVWQYSGHSTVEKPRDLMCTAYPPSCNNMVAEPRTPPALMRPPLPPATTTWGQSREHHLPFCPPPPPPPLDQNEVMKGVLGACGVVGVMASEEEDEPVLVPGQVRLVSHNRVGVWGRKGGVLLPGQVRLVPYNRFFLGGGAGAGPGAWMH